MYLVKVNGVKCVIVERMETVDALRAVVEQIAKVFNSPSILIEVETMPRVVLGGGSAAEHSAFVAMLHVMKGVKNERRDA